MVQFNLPQNSKIARRKPALERCFKRKHLKYIGTTLDKGQIRELDTFEVDMR